MKKNIMIFSILISIFLIFPISDINAWGEIISPTKIVTNSINSADVVSITRGAINNNGLDNYYYNYWITSEAYKTYGDYYFQFKQYKSGEKNYTLVTDDLNQLNRLISAITTSPNKDNPLASLYLNLNSGNFHIIENANYKGEYTLKTYFGSLFYKIDFCENLGYCTQFLSNTYINTNVDIFYQPQFYGTSTFNTFEYFFNNSVRVYLNKDDIFFYDGGKFLGGSGWLVNIDDWKPYNYELSKNDYITFNKNLSNGVLSVSYNRSSSDYFCTYYLDGNFDDLIQADCNLNKNVLPDFQYFVVARIEKLNGDIVIENEYNKILTDNIYLTYSSDFFNGYQRVIATINNFNLLPANYDFKIFNSQGLEIDYTIENNQIYMTFFKNDTLLFEFKNLDTDEIFYKSYYNVYYNSINPNNPDYNSENNIIDYFLDIIPDLSSVSSIFSNFLSLLFNTDLGKLVLFLISGLSTVILIRIFRR